MIEKRKKLTIAKILLVLIILINIISISIILIVKTMNYNQKDNEIDNNYINKKDYIPVVNATKRTVKLMILSFDPIISHPTTGELIRLHEYPEINFKDTESIVKRHIANMRAASNDMVDFQIIEFHDVYDDYGEYIKLVDKMSSEQFTVEKIETLLKKAKTEKGSYWNWWTYDKENYPDISPDVGFSFDYNYYINKYDIIDKVNKNEIDEVWVSGSIGSGLYESTMFGPKEVALNWSANVLNGVRPFAFMAVSPERPDTHVHCVSHRIETLMYNYVYAPFKNIENGIDIGSQYSKVPYTTPYVQLNDWEKFTSHLSTYPNNIVSGNCHYPPNAKEEYDYNNSSVVNSYALDWRYNFPNLKGEMSSVNNLTWLEDKAFLNATYDSVKVNTDILDSDIAFNLWWMKNMPHVSGISNKGYLNNWWEYIYTTNFVDKVQFKLDDKKVYSDIDLNFNTSVSYKLYFNYYDGTILDGTGKAYIQNDNTDKCVVQENTIFGKQKGICNIKFYRDGRYASVVVNVKLENWKIGNAIDDRYFEFDISKK